MVTKLDATVIIGAHDQYSLIRWKERGPARTGCKQGKYTPGLCTKGQYGVY